MNLLDRLKAKKQVSEPKVPAGFKVRPGMERIAEILAKSPDKRSKDDNSILATARAGLNIQEVIYRQRFSLEEIVYVVDSTANIIEGRIVD